jgi:hypothetical protein
MHATFSKDRNEPQLADMTPPTMRVCWRCRTEMESSSKRKHVAEFVKCRHLACFTVCQHVKVKNLGSTENQPDACCNTRKSI